ncbi:DNA replication/repair protein RecF [Thermosynechococcus sp. PP45]|uniref:DNA replication/repair protein RecF n=1 Tax=unclassified Thermosynechococcus TaxID=2622553 RepID=UPI0026711DF6|nr:MULTISPECIES: DNA replication/repair protein RecF [unclassified Thermosynechococcus]MDR7923015.1 DNA replication/repair protein RecF [Thermosynechococcus sp. HY213]WKT81135.1 DNA replication/repair protein RecF [Thermosynechococcus sp. PP45]WNC22192.1 DNA replication/repair protein RecF [Thermosynechococcus sp. PP22]WNC24746.1 DNA replication/repair protein RecF [Thermosynechococcus sp. PP551]WNC27323.1 DNA replication/repair protein RecF [Thermosynechococcus sp. PP555]
MFLKSLHLRHFRNYSEQSVTFAAPKTIVVGDNAQGKSNLLEAVEWLATLQSHRTHRDRDLIQQGQESAQIEATLERQGVPLDLAVSLRPLAGRVLQVNGCTVKRTAEFLGQLNAVEFSCLDLELVRGTPAIRRNWLDRILVQLEPLYSQLLQTYQKALRQRNALLKQAGSQGWDEALWQAWNQQLVINGTRIIRRRQRLIERLAPLAQEWHRVLSGDRETLTLTYESHVPLGDGTSEVIVAAFNEALAARRTIELLQKTSLVGPHRDDVGLCLNEQSARQFASQGQQRTLVLALKLAELALVESVVGDTPLLLLDDVLAELDLQRQGILLEVMGDRYQTLITTTHLAPFATPWRQQAQILKVTAGTIASVPDTAAETSD